MADIDREEIMPYFAKIFDPGGDAVADVDAAASVADACRGGDAACKADGVCAAVAGLAAHARAVGLVAPPLRRHHRCTRLTSAGPPRRCRTAACRRT